MGAVAAAVKVRPIEASAGSAAMPLSPKAILKKPLP
jgi:hypothetical protein